MNSEYTLFIILGIAIVITIIIAIAIVKLITKIIEKREVNSILEFMKKETEEDKQVKEKFNECIKIIEQNKKE